MKHGTTKTLRVGCILLAILFLFGALALMPQPVRAQPVSTVPVGGAPRGVAVSPDGAYAYVANYGSNSVSVISTASNAVVATIPVGGGPWSVAVSPDGAYAYVTNAGDNTVSVISTASNAVVATVPVGNEPFGVAVTPDGAYAYVTNAGDNTVSVISTATSTVTATVPVGTYPYGVAVSPDGAYAYVTNGGDGTVSVISTASNAVVATVPVGEAPTGVAVTPDGAYAYVTNNPIGTVSVISTATSTVTATVPVGNDPFSVAVSPDGAYAYVTNGGDGTVSVISTASNAVVATVPVGSAPWSVAVSPDGAYAYVANFGSGSVSVISIAGVGGVATQLVVSSLSGTTQTAGAPFTVTVTAEDAYGNPVLTYSGSATISSTDSYAVLSPIDVSITDGFGTCQVTLETVGLGTQTIYATDDLAVLTASTEAFTVGLANPTLFLHWAGDSEAGGSGGSGIVFFVGLQHTSGSNAGGTVTYTLYSGIYPSGTQVGTSKVLTVPLGAPTVSFIVNTAGPYYLTAVYSGDSNNNGATAVQAVTVRTAMPRLATSAPQRAVVGTGFVDSAVLSGTSGSNAGGTVTYTLYTGSYPSGTQVGSSSVVTVSGGVVPNSASFIVSTVGSYYFAAVYSGDSNNNGFTAANEAFTVGRASPTLTSSAPVGAVVGTGFVDSAVLSGTSGSNVGGTVTYTLYTGSYPSGTQVDSQNVQAVSGGVVPNSLSFIVTTVGSYYFTAVYSGDTNNNGATAHNEAFTVALASSTTTVIASSNTVEVDQTTTTGIDSTISGTSLAGTQLTVSSAYFGATQPTGTGSVEVGGIFYDIAVTANTQLDSNVMVTVSITNPIFTSGYTVSYWNGANWMPVTTQFTAPDTVTFTVPASVLTGTPIMVQPPTTFSVTVTQGANGVIAPGTTVVNYDGNQAFHYNAEHWLQHCKHHS